VYKCRLVYHYDNANCRQESLLSILPEIADRRDMRAQLRLSVCIYSNQRVSLCTGSTRRLCGVNCGWFGAHAALLPLADDYQGPRLW